jgi:methylmalonyl-CoA/ethylmalonyl-CoA epimerase
MELDHVNIATPDADALAAVFADLFDLAIVKRTEVADQGVQVVKLSAGNAVIEMTAPTGPDTPVGRFLAKNRPGLHHVCFRVDDLRAKVAELLAKGVRLVNEEPTIGAAGLPIVFVHPTSCGGVLVELQETPRSE